MQLGELCSLSLQLLPQPLTLLQPGPQPIIHGAATWVPRAAGASLASCGMGAICFQCGSPVGIPACGAALTERQQQPPCMHNATGPTMVSRPFEHILQGHDPPWSGSVQHQGVRGTTFITSANTVGQPWCCFGEGGRSGGPHALPVATAASLVTAPAGAKCRGDSSQMLKKLPDRRLWHMV